MSVLFFGYLDRKWKTLIRTLWFIYTFCIFFYQIFEPKLFNDDDEIIAGVIVLIPLIISYILEPFVNKKPRYINNDESKQTKEKIAFPLLITKKISPINLRQYFLYDGSYISGNKYWFRKLLQWPLIILGIGFYFRFITTYTRSRSLKLSVLESVFFSIYAFLIDIYVIIIIPLNDKLIGIDNDFLWFYIFPVLPLAYLLFSEGKDKNIMKS